MLQSRVMTVATVADRIGLTRPHPILALILALFPICLYRRSTVFSGSFLGTNFDSQVPY